MFSTEPGKVPAKNCEKPESFFPYKLIRVLVSWMRVEGERLLGQRQRILLFTATVVPRFTHHLTPVPDPWLPQDSVKWARVQLHVWWVALRERKTKSGELELPVLGGKGVTYVLFQREKIFVFKDLLLGKHITGKHLVQGQLIFLRDPWRPDNSLHLTAPCAGSEQ